MLELGRCTCGRRGGVNGDCGGSGWSVEIGPTAGMGRGVEKPVVGVDARLEVEAGAGGSALLPVDSR